MFSKIHPQSQRENQTNKQTKKIDSTKCRQGCGEVETSLMARGRVNGAPTLGNGLAASQNVRHRIAI